MTFPPRPGVTSLSFLCSVIFSWHSQLNSRCFLILCLPSEEMKTWVVQSCPTLCNPRDRSPPGSSVHGILQARMPEWVAVPPPGRLPDPGMKPAPLKSPALAGRFFITSATKYMYVCISSVQFSCSLVSDSLQPKGLYSPRNPPGQNTGVGSLSLLQGITPTQRLIPGLPHYRRILYQLSHVGSPHMYYTLPCVK